MSPSPPQNHLIPCPSHLTVAKGGVTHTLVRESVRDISDDEWHNLRKFMIRQADQLSMDRSLKQHEQPHSSWIMLREAVVSLYPFLNLYEDAWPLRITWDISSFWRINTIRYRSDKRSGKHSASADQSANTGPLIDQTNLDLSVHPETPKRRTCIRYIGNPPPKIIRTVVTKVYSRKQRRSFVGPNLLCVQGSSTMGSDVMGEIIDYPVSTGTMEPPNGFQSDTILTPFLPDAGEVSTVTEALSPKEGRSQYQSMSSDVLSYTDFDLAGTGSNSLQTASVFEVLPPSRLYDAVYYGGHADLFEPLSAIGISDDEHIRQFMRLGPRKQRDFLDLHLEHTQQTITTDIFSKARIRWIIPKNEHENWIGNPLCPMALVLRVLRLDAYRYTLLQERLVADYEETFGAQPVLCVDLQYLKKWSSFRRKVQARYPILRDYEDFWAIHPIILRGRRSLPQSGSTGHSTSETGTMFSKLRGDRDDVYDHLTLQGVAELAPVAQSLNLRSTDDLAELAARPEAEFDDLLSGSQISHLQKLLFKTAVRNV